MATFNFFLRQPYLPPKRDENDEIIKDENGKREYILNPERTKIHLHIIQDAKNKVKILTEHDVLTRYWDFKKQRMKPQATGATTVNDSLNKLYDKIKDQYNRFIAPL